MADPIFDAIVPGRTDPLGRPPVAQTFEYDGEVFTVVNNHFKSKGCTGADDANMDQGDGQSCFNPVRVEQAMVAQAGCDLGQGYLLSRPLEAPDLARRFGAVDVVGV